MYTFDKTLELLNRAVDERGDDYVYVAPEGDMCLYFEDGQPSCIVGLVSTYAGLSDEDFINWEGRSPDNIPFLSEVFDKEALSLLSITQMLQDEQYNWGSAIKEAIINVATLVKDDADASNPNDD